MRDLPACTNAEMLEWRRHPVSKRIKEEFHSSLQRSLHSRFERDGDKRRRGEFGYTIGATLLQAIDLGACTAREVHQVYIKSNFGNT